MSDNNLTLNVVVSGQPTAVRVNRNQSIEHLIKEALKESGNKGQPSQDWELRTTDGILIEQALRIDAAGLVDGMTLYLSPRAGAGGNA